MALRSIYHLCQAADDMNAERLAAAFFVNANWAFKKSWHLIKPFVSKVTARKVRWLGPDEAAGELLRWVEPAVLEGHLGGTAPRYPAILDGFRLESRKYPLAPEYDLAQPDPYKEALPDAEGCGSDQGDLPRVNFDEDLD